MKKIFIIFLLFFLTVCESYAYTVKLYDQYGNHIGSAKKNGEQYEIYNLNNDKVESYDDLFDKTATKQIITEYSRVIYDQNLRPVGTFTEGIYGNVAPIDTFGIFRYYTHPVYGIPKTYPQPLIILPESKFRPNGTLRGTY